MEINFINNNIPKYQQIINAILNGIRAKELVVGSKIPSLNYMIKSYGLSQDTVLNAYNKLKAKGIISSQVGKGYYISKTNIDQKHKIFVLFNDLTLYKEDLYRSMVKALGAIGDLDLFFHHDNSSVYKSLINQAKNNYTSYIIMPILEKGLDQFIIETLPVKSVFILDLTSPDLKSKYPFVCQNFENDLYKAFKKNIKLIRKYKRLRLLNTDKHFQILEIETGIKKFAENYKIPCLIEMYIPDISLQRGDLIICINDRDLVKVILDAQKQHLKVGQDFGIVSYNETELKKVVGGGITTISTDFNKMGALIIDLVIHKKRDRIYNTAVLNIRNSL